VNYHLVSLVFVSGIFLVLSSSRGLLLKATASALVRRLLFVTLERLATQCEQEKHVVVQGSGSGAAEEGVRMAVVVLAVVDSAV
jgi:hypothetical protein